MSPGSPRERPPTVLMLQGPLGPLYGQIATCLLAAGGRVFRVNFSGNDVVDWPHPGALAFRGRIETWRQFLEDQIDPLGVEALLLHGDRRLYHREAIAWASARGIDVLVTELGYLRPDWMTLERGGGSTLSRFPNDPLRIRRIAELSPEIDLTPIYRDRIWPLVIGELRFTISNLLLRPFFPHYRSHRTLSPWLVYSGWVAGRLRTALCRRSTASLPERARFVFALQLEGDFQLRDHSPFNSVADTVTHVVTSFATHAPAGSILVVKPHPHEFARRRLLAVIAAEQKRNGLGGRVVVVEDQSIRDLCTGAAGFVTVNSSAGLEALAVGCPVHCIMPTIYDVPGLTSQPALTEFWARPTPPDPGLFQAFTQALAGTVLVRGTLYEPEGCRAAARAMADRIGARSVNTAGAFVEPPPRLSKAEQMGVVYD